MYSEIFGEGLPADDLIGKLKLFGKLNFIGVSGGGDNPGAGGRMLQSGLLRSTGCTFVSTIPFSPRLLTSYDRHRRLLFRVNIKATAPSRGQKTLHHGPAEHAFWEHFQKSVDSHG